MNKDRKQQLEELMKNYVNNHNCFDVNLFRKEHPQSYALLPHYYGGVNQALEENGWIKVDTNESKSGTRVTLRNQLAYDMLKHLRKTNSLEEIAQQYGVSRAAVGQLFKALKTTIENDSESVE